MTVVEHKNLAEALLAFQAEAPTLRKDGVNPHFRSKFTPLDTIAETIRPLLVKHGLVWQTFPCVDNEGEPALRYTLTHAPSNDSQSDVMRLLLSKADPQGQGSGITYARRYSVCAVLDLVADEDDDGNSASRRQPPPASQPTPTAAPVQPTERLASAKQRGLINARAGEHRMPASVLANVLLTATGNESREFVSEEAAQEWLKRGLDRLPAASVSDVLKGIEEEASPE